MELPVRSSPRASRYDYSSSGVYFVTICTRDREEYFGKVVDKKMVLNEIGKVCEEEIKRLNERETVDVHERIVMPNHVHVLLAMDERLPNEPRRDGSINRPNIISTDTHSDALGKTNRSDALGKTNHSDALMMRPYRKMDEQIPNEPRRDALVGRPGKMRMQPRHPDIFDNKSHSDVPPARPYRWPNLGIIINVLKWNVTKYTQIHNIPFARQSRYHDHIIRNPQEYDHIKHYIQTNPIKREDDQFWIEI